MTFPDDDIQARMVLLLRNKIMPSLLLLIIVKSSYSVCLVRITLEPIQTGFFGGRMKKKEEINNQDYDQFHLQGCWLPFFEHMFLVCLLSVSQVWSSI